MKYLYECQSWTELHCTLGLYNLEIKQLLCKLKHCKTLLCSFDALKGGWKLCLNKCKLIDNGI